jgi:hypothetical protein
METPPFLKKSPLLFAGLLLVSAISARAQDSTPEPMVGDSVHSAQSEVAQIGLLQDAYWNLSSAKHDYWGHRAHAQYEVGKAIHDLGGDPEGEHARAGHPKVEHAKVEHAHKESQAASDDKLREARSVLASAKEQLSGSPRWHVHHAIEEIDRALARK